MGVHPQALVHAWGVGKEGSEESLENETEIHEVILHSLLEYRVLPGLANNQISPLHHHDGHEESCVASVLKNLAVSVGPLLSIRILEIVNSSAVPSSAETEQLAWPESVLAEDDKVNEETSRCLDHTNLIVSHGDGGHHVSSQVNTEDCDGSKGQGDISKNEKEEGRDLGNIGSKSVSDGFLQVVEDKTTFFNACDNGSKVVIEQDHVSGLLGYIGSSNTHGNSDISFLESRRIVYTVTCYGNNCTHTLATLHNVQLLLWGSSGEHDLGVIHQDFINLLLAQVFQLSSVNNGSSSISWVDVLDITSCPGSDVFNSLSSLRNDSNRPGNSLGSDGMVSSNHNDLDTSRSALEDSVRYSSSWRINHGHQTNKPQAINREVDVVSIEGISDRVCQQAA